MKTIATPTDIRQKGRQMGKIDDNKLQAFINEVEMTIIRRKLGDELYIQLSTDENLSEDLQTLVDGGNYTIDSKPYLLTGLKTAIAYYVYAQNVLAGDYESTRYGMRIKDDDYSSVITQKERSDIAGQATDIADAYLEECLAYCDKKGISYLNGRSMRITSGCIIRKVSL